MKAVILSGGKGTRFLPITETVPKALVPAGRKTLLEIAIDQLPSSIDTVIITTKYLGEKIVGKLGNEYGGKKLIYAAQPIDKDGTWSALYAAKEHICDGGQFCALGCDDFFKTEEIERAIEAKKNGMGITAATMPAKYHGIVVDDQSMVKGLQRHPNKNREELLEDKFANGFFIVDSKIFDFEPVQLIDGEYGLPQTLLAHTDYPLHAFLFNYWQPCNTFEDLEKLKQDFML
ncbi:MAG TPA: NDP-sugar synthase [Candidatus Paceibacterota bacterium]|nr:NDP-sugar synthase [Candidatus Paceibacterota bacterium]